jgi:hypothetical protein
MNKYIAFLTIALFPFIIGFQPQNEPSEPEHPVTINKKADGYHGIWYMNTKLDNKYKYKYSGGLGTYCAKHRPFAIYSEEVNKTFFCYGGTMGQPHLKYDFTGPIQDSVPGILYHMVGCYDHETGKVSKPTILLDKMTWDAHDNPVISMDEEGYIWIFSTSHGRSRPSYIHKSKEPYDISSFERIHPFYMKDEEKVPFGNFSYMQPWYIKDQGFMACVTRYNFPTDRTPCFMKSRDGKEWTYWKKFSLIGRGSYQISYANKNKIATLFNIHPEFPGQEIHPLNYRSNLYYLESKDFGETWQSVDGQQVELPLKNQENPALVHDYLSNRKVIYLKDIKFDQQGNPVLLYIKSDGYKSGPANDPRVWTLAYRKNNKWHMDSITTSDNNYDMGSIFIEADEWKIIAPVETGPQPYNTGGEIAMWVSKDKGQTWKKQKQLTSNSEYNHTYVRKPVNAHDDFYALWADGHGRKPSESRLFFCDRQGNVYKLPESMENEFEKPVKVHAQISD